MPDDTITLVSTTDTPEQVQEALTNKPAADKPVETPAEGEGEIGVTGSPGEPGPPGAESETPAQKAERETKEASEAGSRLAKRKKSIQDEIDELTRSKHTVRRDVEAEEARLNELRQQRQQWEPPQPPPQARETAPPEGQGTESRPEPKLDAVDESGNAKYATYEDYLSDHAKWGREEAVLAARQVIEQEKLAERERIERDSASRAVNERLAAYNANLETFKQTHADFDAAFADAKEAVQETLVALGPQALKIIDGFTVFDAEDGPSLTYHLLKHPDELRTIALKPPAQQLVHLARLEERIRPAGAKRSGPSAGAASVNKAPEPIKPVGSGPTATTVPLDEESYQDYRARRERELRAKRGY